MRTLFLSLFILFSHNQLFGNDSLLLIRSIPMKARLFSTDPLGNIYVVKENNTLIRFNEHGDSIGVFNEIKKGRISQIDATNPLKVLLYFSDYNQIVVLNNMLTQKTTLKLTNAGLNAVSCIANSADGNFWAYDAGLGSLIKLDEQLNILQNNNLRTISENPELAIHMLESEREVYLSSRNDGVRKFDAFGFFVTNFRLPVKEFQVFNHQFIYYSNPHLISYNQLNFVERKLLLPNSNDIISSRWERNTIYVLRNNQLDIYQLISN